MNNRRKPINVTKSLKIPKELDKAINKMRGTMSFTSYAKAALVDKISQKNDRDLLSMTAMNEIQEALDRLEDNFFEMNQELEMLRRWMFHRDISFNLHHSKLPTEVRKDLIHSAKERSKENLYIFLQRYGYDTDIFKDIYKTKKTN